MCNQILLNSYKICHFCSLRLAPQQSQWRYLTGSRGQLCHISAFYPNRKALLSRYAKAILAFRWSVPHPIVTHTSVFNADQCGMGGFFIRTLGQEWGHPHGEPQYQQGQGIILEIVLFNIFN